MLESLKRLLGRTSLDAAEAGSLEYRDRTLGFSFRLPGFWTLAQSFEPAVCCAVCEGGEFILQCGEVEDHLTSRHRRERELFAFLGQGGVTRLAAVDGKREFCGEGNVIFFTYRGPDAKDGFGISVVHGKLLYNFQIDGLSPDRLQRTMTALEQSFRFA
jgi:hypothetical protein